MTIGYPVEIKNLLNGEDALLGRLWGGWRGKSEYISTPLAKTLKAGAGVLHSITVCESAAGEITIYDNMNASGKLIAVLKASIGEATYTLDCEFSTGLTIFSNGPKILVSYL